MKRVGHPESHLGMKAILNKGPCTAVPERNKFMGLTQTHKNFENG